jgi:hypothetical protein
LPTAAEVRKLIPQVPDVAEPKDIALSSSVRKFLEMSAVKLEKDDVMQALVMLRSTQTALRAAHKADLRAGMPSMHTANVFARVPSAEMSSANNAMLQTQDTSRTWKRLELQVGAMVDRIRRRYFHGHYNGPSTEARLSTEDDMTAVDKFLALAGAPITTGKDVSFPTESDTAQEVPLLQLKGSQSAGFKLSPKALADISMLSPLDRLKVNTWLKECGTALNAKNLQYATELLLRVKSLAFATARFDLEGEMADWVHGIVQRKNSTHEPDTAWSMRIEEKVIPSQNSPQTVADTGNSTPAKLTASLR